MTFDPDPAAVALELEAWAVIDAAVDKILAEELYPEIEANGLASVVRRLVEDGDPIELVAMLAALRADAFQISAAEIVDIDGPGDRLAAWEQRARQFLCSVIGEGDEPHIHHC